MIKEKENYYHIENIRFFMYNAVKSLIKISTIGSIQERTWLV